MKTLFFYDLETTGFNPREGRIMQFAGQRTDLNLKSIGKPYNFLIKITPDILPDPDAVLITGISPQQTLSEGISEHDFLELFHKEVSTPDTIFAGYNTIRFDDEFMRHTNYRNFWDPYEWQWQDGRGRWDLLDVVRMTRALRPEGIKWPVDSNGKASNRLDLLASINKLGHVNAHDALSDVRATISLAQLVRSKQPKLFDYMLDMRDKQKISKLAMSGQLYVYTSGKYPSEYEKTTVVTTIMPHPKRQAVIVYDLRYDPSNYKDLNPQQLTEAWKRYKPEEGVILPVKTMQFNRCPAVAPLSVLDDKSIQRLQLDMKLIEANAKTLQNMDKWKLNLGKALEILDKKQQERLIPDPQDVDNQLYDGFFDGEDKKAMEKVRRAEPDELGSFPGSLKDKRLQALISLYKARNYPGSLSPEENEAWEAYRVGRLTAGGEESRLARYFRRIDELLSQKHSTVQQHLLEDLKIYGESVMPFE